MLKHYAIIRESARHVAEAANGTLTALRDGRIEQEPAFTDRMLGRIEHAMEGFHVKNLRWTAKTLTDRGGNSQESQYGADFMGVFHADLPDYKVAKGFLAQAKRIEPNERLSADARLEMQEQCAKMLNLSPCASYLFLYAKKEITVVPARSVVRAAGKFNPHDLYGRSVATFFEDHFECFIGDEFLDAAHADTLRYAASRNHVLMELQAKYQARRLLYLGLEPESQQEALDL